MWFYPPEPPGVARAGGVLLADSFFRSRVFFWRPVGVWGYSVRCPRKDCPARELKDVFLSHCGYSKTVRQICDLSGWYSMLTEVLACNACRKAAQDSEEHSIGRFLSWDNDILSQLSPGHREIFPAVLAPQCGVDKQVLSLIEDCAEGNTMTKLHRQILERHSAEYLHRLDLYTTLLTQISKAGGIVRSMGAQEFQPPRRKLPPPKLLRKVFLISQLDKIEDYRTQIMSTFGQVLKFDSTRKICKKLSGEGKGTAAWCTNVGNEQGQILTSVLTCAESLTMLRPMALGLMDRYQKAGEAAPELMYVDRGCCRSRGLSAVGQLFDSWADSGMIVRLDAFYWIHSFDAALLTNHHAKYSLFKSALSAAVFAYNKDDMALLVESERAGHHTGYRTLTDIEVVEKLLRKDHLKHYVRRITVGAQETFRRVQRAIDILKGPAGKDENQIHLFKDAAAIDHVWDNQQKHLECLQDPPGRDMYTVVGYAIRNGVRLPRYRCVRSSNSLEGFHAFIPGMIPGPHCGAVPFQVYLLSGIARWNADREACNIKGQKGRVHRLYSTPLIHRINKRCQEFFHRIEEVNHRLPVPTHDERLGLEYLLAQSTDEFNVREHYSKASATILATEDHDDESEEEEKKEEAIEEDDDAGYNSDRETQGSAPLGQLLQLTERAVASELDPCAEDVCSLHHLPGYQHVETLSRVLVEIALEEGKLSLTDSVRQRVLAAWNQLDLHDRQIQEFDSLYASRWGHSLFGLTNGDPASASLVQKLKLSKRYSPAHLLDSRKNRLMYCVIKQLWLHPGCGAARQGSPVRQAVTRMYQRAQQRVTVDDLVLKKLGIPFLKVNSKCVSDFIRRQEAMSANKVTDQGLSVLQRPQSLSDTSLPPALELPDIRPQTDRPQVCFNVVPSMAGTRQLKRRYINLPIAPRPSTFPSTPLAGGFAVVPPHYTVTTPPSQTLVVVPSAPLAVHGHVPPPNSTAAPTASQTTDTAHLSGAPQGPARSTYYKRLANNKPAFAVNSVKYYNCALCGQSTQGHKKYKKKTYCETARASTSKGLSGRSFANFVNFKGAVDDLLK
ncbi:uncharacterized protein LOC130927717 isoform X2 [Corythoichthys intestinalis]|nr:uncharacterized protein LOC130927717 isoform X2 [Corythoichthys intestinalis]